MKKLFALFVLLFTFHLSPFTANAQWTQLSIPTSTASQRAAYFKDANNGFVAGAERIRKTNNGGATWDTCNYGIYWAYLNGCIVENIHFVSATEGIAAGWNFWDNCEIVFKTHDGGNTWTDIRWGNNNAAFGTYLYDMHFPTATTGFCVGDLGHIIKSTDGGDNWAYVNYGTSLGLKGVYFTSASNGIAVGDEVIIKTTNGGSSWTSQSFTGVYFTDVTFTSATVGYAVASDAVYKTTDGGTTWNVINANVGGEDITAVNSDTIYIASYAGIYKSNNAGAQFLQQPSLYPANNFYGIYFYNSTLGFAMNYAGKVFKTTTDGDAVQQNDAGVTYIEQLPYGTCQGVEPVQVKIKNFGQSNLTQATINWKVKGVAQTPFVWNGNLAFDSTSTLFSIGNYNFGFGQSDIVAYTTQANSVSDYIHYNDTTTSSFQFQRLSGSYTVGGTNPSYATLDDAVSALNNYGTCGNVEFKIRNGTYQPSFSTWTINNFFKTNLTDSVVFSAESGDSSQVVLQGFNAAFSLNKSKNVSFSKVTIELVNNGNAITLIDSTEDINFINCVFNLSINGGIAITHSGKALRNLLVNHCKFSEGFDGVNIASSPATEIMDSITIVNSVFNNVAENGILIPNSKKILIQNNLLFSNYTAFSAILLGNCNNGFVIDKNKMMTAAGENVLYLSGCQNIPGTEGIVSNNFISSNKVTNTLTQCVHLFNCIGLKLIHNSILCDVDAAIRIYQNDTLQYPMHTFQNNIVCNLRNNVIFNWGMPTTVSNNYMNKVFKDIGYNAYYNNPAGSYNYPYKFFSNGDFTDWKGYYPSDTTSVFTFPQFTSYLEYHITPNTSNILLSNKGKFIPGYVTDIDGVTRTATPDIGCAEFNLKTVDAGVKNFIAQTRICSGVNSVDVRVGNFGVNNITSGTINWKVNGVAQTAYTWSGNISSGDSSGLVSIGTYNFVNGNSYTIQAWMSNANSGADANHINDTATVSVTAKGLSGIYTIGGLAPNYATVSAAVTDLLTNGLCGPVTFNIRNGVYNDSIPLTPVAGSSSTNTITFQSESGDSSAVTLWNFGKRVVRLDTASYITLNKMTIIDSSNTVKGVIYFRGRVNHITIKNCVLKALIAPNIIGNEGVMVSDILVDRNSFTGGQSAINLYYNNLNFYLNDRITITNNTFLNQYSDVIQITRPSYVTIDHNNFQNTLSGVGSNLHVIYIYGFLTTHVSVTNNVINVGRFSHGIFYAGNGLPNNKSLFANNMISMTGMAPYWGMNFQGDKNVRVIYNSCLIDSSALPGACLYAPDAEGEVFNNSLYHGGSGVAAYYGYVNYNWASNYNNYFADSAPPVQTYFGYYSLASWQLSSGMDANSFSGDPMYVSPTDLHSSGSYDLNNNGVIINDISKDIDGEARGSSPDIGADEFNLVLQANDAGVKDFLNPDTLCAGSNPVSVRIRNYGSATLTSATINWTVNGVLQTPFAWSGSIASLAVSNYVSIGSYNFGALDTFNIVAWTTNPNGTTDTKAQNDTSKLNNLLSRMSGIYTVGGTNPDFATLILALQKVKSIGICGPVTLSLRDGSYPGPNNNINAFVGLSPTNTFTIQSESGDSNAVLISNNNSTATLLFSNCDYIRLKNINVYGSGNYDAVRFDNGSDYNSVTGCIMNGRLTIYNNSHHNTLEHNLVNNEIYLYGQTNLVCIGNLIRFNTILNSTGIHFYYQDSIVVEGNTIENITGQMPNSNFGIKTLGNNSRQWITKNKITGNFSRMFDISADGTVNDTAIIANNILIAGDNAGTAVHLQGGYAKFVYNTIYVPATSVASPCENVGAPFDDGLYIANNQFITYNYSYAYYWGQITFTTATISDYNNYYTTGSTLINISLSSLYPTIDSFNTAHPTYDANSTDVDPQFSSPQFLYPTNSLAQGTGTPVYGVIDDYNGLLRDPNNPTMGALEAPPVIVDDSTNKDVAIKLLNTNLSLGNNTISVQVNNLKPFLIDTVYHNYIGTVDTLYLSYSVNGGTPVNQTWIGSLAMNDSINFNFTQQFNVPKGRLYNVLVQVTLPPSYNTVALKNDTATYEIGLPMIGVYTVGGTNPDFVNLDEANFNYYKIHTSGACTFNIRPGLDSLFSIYQYQDGNSLTFRSSTGNANDVQIKIMDVYDSYMINFKKVTLFPRTDNNYLYNYKGAEFIGGQFVIDSCIIRGLNDPDYRNGITFSHSDSIAVTNCSFVDLENGINFTDDTWFGSNYFYGKCFVMNNTFDSVSTCIHVLGSMTDTVYISHNNMKHLDLGIDYNPSSYIVGCEIKYNTIAEAASFSLSSNNINYVGSSYFNVYNNMLGGNVNIGNLGNDALNFNYNSVSGFLQITDCANLHARNNTVQSNGLNPALIYDQSSYPSTVYDCDYNNYYAPNATNFAFVSIVNGSTGSANNIPSLVSLTGNESHSKNSNPYYFSVDDLHSHSLQLNNAGVAISIILDDIEGQLRNSSKPDIGCDEFNPSDSLVWPGDCNYDGVANNYDLLSVGLYNGQTGASRPFASTLWFGQNCNTWGTLQYCGWDKKHVDCNGNGIVEKVDGSVIKSNYGQNHAFRPAPLPNVNGQPELYFVTNDTVVAPGDTVTIELWAGSAALPLDSIYGIAFDVAYPSSLVLPGSMDLTFPPSFLGIDNVTTVTISNIGTTASGTVVRTTGTDTSGYGMFAVLKFVIDSTVTPPLTFNLSYSNYLGLSASGDSVIFNLLEDSIEISNSVSINELDESSNFNIYPNPTNQESTLSYSLKSGSHIKIELLNVIGETISVLKDETQNAGYHQLKLNATKEKLSSGIYFIKMIVGDKSTVKKLVVE